VTRDDDGRRLLLRTGDAPISIVMKRLLAACAASLNRRHRRHGNLFPNRYKSIYASPTSGSRI
jgi:hypothetical protein